MLKYEARPIGGLVACGSNELMPHRPWLQPLPLVTDHYSLHGFPLRMRFTSALFLASPESLA